MGEDDPLLDRKFDRGELPMHTKATQTSRTPRLIAAAVLLGAMAIACTPGSSPSTAPASPSDSGMMEHSASPEESGMMEHSASPEESGMMEHSPSPSS
jgi:hypothetical protein